MMRGDAGATGAGLSWFNIVRLGLAQTALGGIVVLCTSTFNRVMAVELQLLASLPAALVAWHYVVQLTRPRWGHGSDVGRARTPFILGGIGCLAVGAALAAQAIGLMQSSFSLGLALSIVAYALIGGGVAAGGTSLLALMASAVAPQRRPAAAALTWILMLVGIVFTAIVAGQLLAPYSPQRLAAVTIGVGICAFGLACVAVWGVERGLAGGGRWAGLAEPGGAPKPAFMEALRQTWADGGARRFTVFVFVSMLAFNAQDMILEPFVGLVFGFDVRQSTQLSGMHQGGVLLGMLLVGAIGARAGGHTAQGMRAWVAAGCAASGAALLALAFVGLSGLEAGVRPVVFALGFSNGVFAVAAVGAMFALAGAGGGGREGVRMGVWGASQAIAFGLGGFAGAVGYDLFKLAFGAAAPAFSTVFALEGLLFFAAALLAVRLGGTALDGAVRAPAMATEFTHDMRGDMTGDLAGDFRGDLAPALRETPIAAPHPAGGR
jgi:BCD family chlorophyll transporter-like MFS transporter